MFAYVLYKPSFYVPFPVSLPNCITHFSMVSAENMLTVTKTIDEWDSNPRWQILVAFVSQKMHGFLSLFKWYRKISCCRYLSYYWSRRFYSALSFQLFYFTGDRVQDRSVGRFFSKTQTRTFAVKNHSSSLLEHLNSLV